jgi:hypothetical protein
MRIIDCSNATQGSIPQLKAAGVGAVGRYFGSAAWKCANRAECDALRGAGIDVFAIYETTATMMLGGHAAGVAGAKAALAGVAAAGGPANAVIFFCCDTDTGDTVAVNAYLAGAATVMDPRRVGIYGSGAVCASALASGFCAYGWRSLSTGWRGYLLRPAGLVLLQSGKSYGAIGNLSYDANTALAAYFGQWGGAAAPITLDPAPKGFMSVYQLYRASNADHIYSGADEAKSLIAGNLYALDGTLCNVSLTDKLNTVPLHRFHNVKTGVHFDTASEVEIAGLNQKLWNHDGVTAMVNLSKSGVEVGRWRSRRDASLHIFQTTQTPAGFVYEGPAFWCGVAA